MTKRKKKNAITLVSLLLVLVAMIGVYVWYSGRNVVKDDDNSDQTQKQKEIIKVDTSKVTEIQYKNADTDLTLKLEDGVWMIPSEPERPISQDIVSGLLKQVSSIKATQTVVEKPESLSDFGLDKPSNDVSLTLTDGSNVSIKIGDELASAGGYYAMANDEQTVYVIPINYSFTYKDSDFTKKDVAPEITAENITYISVDKREGKDFELKYTDPNIIDNSGSNLNPWRILKPYEGNYAADSDKIPDVQAKFTTFDYLSCVDYSGKNFIKYGLDKPAATIDIKYSEKAATPTPAAKDDGKSTNSTAAQEKEYKIYIGNQNDNGDYYVRVDGSNLVDTLDKTTVEAMFNVDVFSILNPFINIPNIDSVDKITADIAGTQYTMGISHTTSKDKNGKETTAATYTFNGKNVDESSFKDLYQKIITAQYDAELKKDINVSALKPVLTLNFHIYKETETTITTSFLPYDDSFYIVDKGTGSYFVVDKRMVDDMAKEISTFTAK